MDVSSDQTKQHIGISTKRLSEQHPNNDKRDHPIPKPRKVIPLPIAQSSRCINNVSTDFPNTSHVPQSPRKNYFIKWQIYDDDNFKESTVPMYNDYPSSAQSPYQTGSQHHSYSHQRAPISTSDFHENWKSGGKCNIYPSISLVENNANPSDIFCNKGLSIRFGKKGASIVDFHKPFGLSASEKGDYVVSDVATNKIFVFDNCGQLTKLFRCNCRIKDVAVNTRNEIMVVVNKLGSAVRCYSMSGQTLGEHGKTITHDEPNGIAIQWDDSVIVTGVQNNTVYILTKRYQMSTKLGRKGVGDGYFQSPVFVACDSKGHIIVSDDVNHNVQVFDELGKFKLRFGGMGSKRGQLLHPKGLATDAYSNIIVADSGNYRVEMFNGKGTYIRTIVKETHLLGEEVRPINVAVHPSGKIAVLLHGNYFAEVRVYNADVSEALPHDHSSP